MFHKRKQKIIESAFVRRKFVSLSNLRITEETCLVGSFRKCHVSARRVSAPLGVLVRHAEPESDTEQSFLVADEDVGGLL